MEIWVLNYDTLALDQAPPLWAPLRFFLFAPLFAIFAGILILCSDASVLMNRYSMDSIIITHMITIGFFGFIMLGALTQMLPVLTGQYIPRVEALSTTSVILLSIGLVCMFFGLYYDLSALSSFAYLYLSGGFLIMLSGIAYAMSGVRKYTATIKAMAVSLSFALMIVPMGAYLLYGYATKNISEYHYIIANIHSTWAIFGFAGILIIGVAFQVLPMFYVAPRFKNFCKKRVVLFITTGLLVWFFLSLFYAEYTLYAKFIITTFFWAFATTVWFKFNKRKNPISDVTIWFWRVASVSLTLGAYLWIFDEFFKHEYIVMVAILIGGGFIFSIMIGMLYKIVPFLIWFHLSTKGYINMPSVDKMIDKNLARVQFVLFVLSLIGFIFSFYFPLVLIPSGFFFVGSMLILEYNLVKVVLIYEKTIKTKPEFDIF